LKQSNKKNIGFTLVEVMVALMIMMVSLLGFLQVSNFIIVRINTSDYRISAINYASGGMEIVRGIRDTYLKQNLNNGWEDSLETEEIDSFLELVKQSENGNFKIVTAETSSGSMFTGSGYSLEAITSDEKIENWELLSQVGFTTYYRKLRITDADNYPEKLKKVTMTVAFDDGTYSDSINLSTFVGDISEGKN